MVRLVVVVMLLSALLGCDRGTPAPATTRPGRPTIASTVPAATDLIIGMGGRDQLVAVSTYDRDRPDVGTLPKAGDYQSADWELLATLRPNVLVTSISPDREPAGFRERAAGLNIDLLNVKIDHLPDLKLAVASLGAALGNPAMAQRARQAIDDKLNATRQRVAGMPAVSALIVLGPDATAVVGPNTYYDELLQVAGGTNAAARLGQSWPMVDREALVSLHPDVVLQLLPNAKPQELMQAKTVWSQLPRGAFGRICTITDPYAEQPGWHLPDLADHFARCLHPSTTPTSAP